MHSISKPNNVTLGILGGGQLGMFLALAAQARGMRVHLYIERAGDHPASAHAQEIFTGNGWSDSSTIKRFAESCDVVLLENEFVPVELLNEISGVEFFPNLPSYAIFQDKLREKDLAAAAGVTVSDYQLVASVKAVQTKLSQWNKLVLKTCRGGYDGTGNLTVTNQTPETEIQNFLNRGPCLAERWVTFDHEVAVMVARSSSQEVVFPVAETIQHHHICHQVIAPARFSDELNTRIQHAALKITRQANGLGLFGVEFFITSSGDILYNETAPRPHNSAHFTIEGCSLSQFDAHISVAVGEALASPRLKSDAVGMLNLLGTPNGTNQLTPLDLFKANQAGHLWLYGKKESRPGRKMGHYTLLGDSASVVLSDLTQLQQRYSL